MNPGMVCRFVGLWLIATCVGLKAEVAEVVVISPHWDGIRQETARAFSEWHQARYGSPAMVRWKDVGGGTSTIVRFLKSEYSQRQPEQSIGIDVFYGGGVDPFLALKEAHLLQRYDPPDEVLKGLGNVVGGIPVYDHEGREWFGAAVSSFGILTNERVRSYTHLPEVKTWEDLANPVLAGWVSSCDPRQSGSILAIYEIILQAYGWEKGWAIVTGLNANVRAFLKVSTGAPKEVAMGDAAYALTIDFQGFAQLANVPRGDMSYVFPEGVSAMNPDAIALLKNPAHPQTAQRFMEFVLSDAGQRLWMLPRGAEGGAKKFTVNRMGVRPGLYTDLAAITPIQINPFEIKQSFHYDPKLGTRRRESLGALLGAVFIDLHGELKEAWKTLRDHPDEEALRRLQTPPITLEQLLDISEKEFSKKSDPRLRTQRINDWQSTASELYRNISHPKRRVRIKEPSVAMLSPQTSIPHSEFLIPN